MPAPRGGRKAAAPAEFSLVRRAAPLLLALTGCSLLAQGRSQEVTFTSDPPGAAFTVAGQSATTPATLELPKDDYRITFEKEGFHPVELDLKRRTSPYFYGSLVMGVIASSADLVTGAWQAFETTEVHVVLEQMLRRIRFHSTPPGAEVRVDGRPIGHTPTWTDLEWQPGAPPKKVELVLDGYHPAAFNLTREDEELGASLEEVVEAVPLDLRLLPPNGAIVVDGTLTVEPPEPVVLEWSVTRTRHALSFSCPGYRPASRVFERAESRAAHTIALEPMLPWMP
jgi:hypothetical protein